MTVTSHHDLLEAAHALFEPGTEFHRAQPLTGGASRHMVAFEARRPDGRIERLVACQPLGGPATSHRVDDELAVLKAAHAAGVPVPRPYGEVPASAGQRPLLVMDWLEGETRPRRILREARFAPVRARLVDQVARAAARLHAVDPGQIGLEAPQPTPAIAACRALERTLDELGEPHPALELGLRWLRLTAPRPLRSLSLVHGDLRLGNLMVNDHRLVGVLDWELAHSGDPAEDLGWLCARPWRFGQDDHPALGLGSRAALLRSYAAGGAHPVTADELRWWEALANARWGVLTIVQAARHLSGEHRSVEHAAVGRRTCEAEWDLLAMVD